jgi:hypothetical protein
MIKKSTRFRTLDGDILISELVAFVISNIDHKHLMDYIKINSIKFDKLDTQIGKASNKIQSLDKVVDDLVNVEFEGYTKQEVDRLVLVLENLISSEISKIPTYDDAKILNRFIELEAKIKKIKPVNKNEKQVFYVENKNDLTKIERENKEILGVITELVSQQLDFEEFQKDIIKKVEKALNKKEITTTNIIGGVTNSPVSSVNGKIGVIVLNTDDIEEGSNNLYFTNERASNAAPVQSVNNQVGDVVTQIVDTRANIFTLTPENGTTAYSTDTKQYYVYNDAWEEFSSIQNTRTSNYDIGYEQESNLAGYGSDYITDKRISNCLIGENAREELGGIRVTYADSLERNIAQYYLDGEWKTALTGVNIQADDTENPVDIEFTDFSPWVLSLITGNSDSLDPNGVPIVQNMKVDMGVYSSPLLIDGGSF